ncbi:guanine nucleotide-exchange factor SEC12-like [Oscarella lobularis]|uniref:guanine nucleotide-exchange factor SEC12-like n=1 Tax=Oscarella lobularis TaxID=121494 RepID=UPI0033134C30
MTLFAADYPLFAIASLKDGCLLVAGGGGASKTGVPNRVEIYRISRGIGDLHPHGTRICTHDVGSRSVMNACVDSPQRYVALGQDASCHVLTMTRLGGSAAARLRKTSSSNDEWVLANFAEKMTDFGRDGVAGFQNVVRFSASGGVLATGGGDGCVRTWKFPAMSPGWVLRGHTGEIDDLDFHHSRDQLVSVSKDCLACVWNLSTGNCVTKLDASRIWRAKQYRHRTCRFGSKRSQVWLYTGFVSNRGAVASYLCQWHGESYKLIDYAKVANDTITKVDASLGGSYVAIGTMSGSIGVYETSSHGLQFVKRVDNVHQTFVTGIAFTTLRDGEMGVASISIDRTCQYTNLERQKSYGVIILFFIPFLIALIFLLLSL